jgi:hypothetical protein
LRNIFDQYSQPENRVTHSLMTAINEDRKLLGLFLHELVKGNAPGDPRKLSMLEQQYPGEDEPSEDDLERRGIPDGWIFDEKRVVRLHRNQGHLKAGRGSNRSSPAHPNAVDSRALLRWLSLPSFQHLFPQAPCCSNGEPCMRSFGGTAPTVRGQLGRRIT